ncbi:MAG: hypothetical protein QM736_15140 [Vicinamibacterales bacterium]
MALKFVLDTLDDVPPTDAQHYTKASDGKFRLALDGDHPDTARVGEFRDKNIALMKDLAKFEGIDPVAAKAALARAQSNPELRVTELEAELARERTARTDAEQKATTGRVRDALRAKALAAGVLPGALDIFLDRAQGSFTMDGDSLKAQPNVFSPGKPGEPLTPDEFIATAIVEVPFLFGRSSGGGAPASRPRAEGSGGGGRDLLNPTPAQLGDPQTAKDIRDGKIRVVYSNS